MSYTVNWVPDKKINYDIVKQLLDVSEQSRHFTNYGPNVKLLETYTREKLKIDNDKAVIVVNNASLGIQILTHGIAVHENNELLQWATQSFTFPPSNQGTLKTSKIFDIDCDGGLNLDEIDNEINGIIVTNIFGNVVDIDKYVNYCNANNKFLIFDNAATAYTFYKGKNCVNYGHGSIISYHHTKPFGFGEGGAIIVDVKYENTIRKLINFGIGLFEDKYYSSDANNCKMSDVSAVFILQYLYDNFDTIISKHQMLYNYFATNINNISNYVKLYPSYHDVGANVLSCFCILFDDADKSTLVESEILKIDIFCRKYYHPLKGTANTTNFFNRILCIPCHKDMDICDIDAIFDVIRRNI